MKRVLISTGATFPFDALFESILSDKVLLKLSTLGVTEVLCQYGGTSTSKAKFDHLVHTITGPVKISGFSLTDNMILEFQQAWLVFSHAGTGTIFDVLRLPPPRPKLIVVANPVLMNGHQSEVAQALERMHCLLYARSVSSDAIIATIDQLTTKFEDLPIRQSITAVVNFEAGVS
ncbi:hypothetical protein V1512DRAFT_271327 [Lipomyces arxii]|uniref:uncharacterized protein n=1 Tax=Lipomyces arxii TaxID=56418 RepID=UPI0034CD9EF9